MHSIHDHAPKNGFSEVYHEMISVNTCYQSNKKEDKYSRKGRGNVKPKA